MDGNKHTQCHQQHQGVANPNEPAPVKQTTQPVYQGCKCCYGNHKCNYHCALANSIPKVHLVGIGQNGTAIYTFTVQPSVNTVAFGAGASPLVVAATTLVGCWLLVKNIVNPSKSGNFVALYAVTLVVIVAFRLTHSFVAPGANVITIVIVFSYLAG